MDPITYSLRTGGRTNSDDYYRTVAAFTDQVLTEGAELTRPLVDVYMAHLAQDRRATHQEHTFELLTLGTLWLAYADDALELGELPRRVLTTLADLREESGSLKPGIDFLRGILATIFLAPVDEPAPSPTLAHLDRLLGWLEATGEFRQEGRHLRSWREFLATLPDLEAAHYLAAAITFAGWFETASTVALGHYTERVEPFLKGAALEHRWREDVIFTARHRVEYHLNMVGAEIMNRAFQADFAAQPAKVVLLPACMHLKPEGECQATETALGLACGACTPTCRVHQITQMGEKYGFAVRILAHESESTSLKSESNARVGIIGIACVMNLVAGGWKAQGMGIPAQCVLLDYCGCRNHWDDEGVPTDINFRQLRRVLAID